MSDFQVQLKLPIIDVAGLELTVREVGVTRHALVEGPFAQHLAGELADERIRDDVAEDVVRERRGIVLKVAPDEVVRDARQLENPGEIRFHSGAEGVEPGGIDYVINYDETVVAERFGGSQQSARFKAPSLVLFGGWADAGHVTIPVRGVSKEAGYLR